MRCIYPDDVEQLVLVNPIGLEDWKAKGVPWQSVDAWYQQELKTTADGIRDYQRSTYYAGTWDAKYERWVQMLAGLYRGPGHDIVSWDMALVDDMAYTQPVFYEFEQAVRAGAADDRRQGHDGAWARISRRRRSAPRSAIIRCWRKRRQAACRGRVWSGFPISGHAPQIQAPDVFHKALLDGLRQ